MAHDAYSPVGYDYNAEHYCLGCIPKVMFDRYGSDGYAINGDNCTECRLDSIAVTAGIADRYDERSFDSGDFPKAIGYHNDLHAECGLAGVDEDYPDGVCYARCGQCHEVIDGVSQLNGPDICPARENDMTT